MVISLRAARVNAGLTQKQAAELLGISESTLINYEKSKFPPKEPIIRKFEKLYGISYQEIDFSSRNDEKTDIS